MFLKFLKSTIRQVKTIIHLGNILNHVTHRRVNFIWRLLHLVQILSIYWAVFNCFRKCKDPIWVNKFSLNEKLGFLVKKLTFSGPTLFWTKLSSCSRALTSVENSFFFFCFLVLTYSLASTSCIWIIKWIKNN